MKQEIIDMITEGVSLNKIKEKTGANKSSLYHHYKKIHGRKYAQVKIKPEKEDSLGEFLGLFAGDGSYYLDKKKYQHKIRIFTGSYEKEYFTFLRKFLTNMFSKPPRQYENKKYNVSITEYYSKDIHSLIKKHLEWERTKSKTIRLKNLKKKEKDFLIGFLRGLFDTDGGINKKKNKVAFGTASKKLAYQIKEILEILELNPGFYKYKEKDFWYIDLYGKRTDKFMKLIKPNNPNKIILRR